MQAKNWNCFGLDLDNVRSKTSYSLLCNAPYSFIYIASLTATLPLFQLRDRLTLILRALVPNEARKPTRRKLRLSPDERRRNIVEEALRFFAEHGFEANTRVLAQRIGVTQPLLFRYFSTKEELIEAVFELALKRLTRRDWLLSIRESEGDIRQRLINFFYSYSSENYDFDWIRLYMFAGLAGGKLNRRYIKLITEPVLRAIAREIRAHFQSPKGRISQEEMEYLWIFHGGLYYYAIRHRIYGMPVDPKALARTVETAVEALIAGFHQFLGKQDEKRAVKQAPKSRANSLRNVG